MDLQYEIEILTDYSVELLTCWESPFKTRNQFVTCLLSEYSRLDDDTFQVTTTAFDWWSMAGDLNDVNPLLRPWEGMIKMDY